MLSTYNTTNMDAMPINIGRYVTAIKLRIAKNYLLRQR